MTDPINPSSPEWESTRLEALQGLYDQQAAIKGQMTAIENGTDFSDAAYLRYQTLQNDYQIVDVNIKTMMPPAVSDTGAFQAGDLRSYVVDSVGGEDAWNKLTPTQQGEYLNSGAIEYQQMMSGEVASRSVGGGPLGEVMRAASQNPMLGGSSMRSPRASMKAGKPGAKPPHKPGEKKKCEGCTEAEKKKKKEEDEAKAKEDAAKQAAANSGGVPKESVVGNEPVPEGINRDSAVYRSIRSGEEIAPDGKFVGAGENNGRYAVWNQTANESLGTTMMYEGKPNATTVGQLLDQGAKFEPRGGDIVVIHYPPGGLAPGTWKPMW